jgi:hypothetical protein
MAEPSEKPQLVWEHLNSVHEQRGKFKGHNTTDRAKVLGGWLVAVMTGGGAGGGVTFYADPEHKWDGGSLS